MYAYQFSLLNNKAFDNIGTFSSRFNTPQHEAALRRSLRTAYIDAYATADPTTMYFYHTTTNSCQQTTALYNPLDHKSVTDPNVTCEQNLQKFLPEQTKGVCFATKITCDATYGQAQQMYFCNTGNNSCSPTSSSYYPTSHLAADNGTLCEDNLKSFRPGTTTEACYTTANECQLNCPPAPPANRTKLYYCRTDSYTCAQTSGYYDATTQVSYDNWTTCQANLIGYVSRTIKTTGVCYAEASSCQSACHSSSSSPTPSPPAPKPGDLNSDNKVDIFDYNVLVGDFGKIGSNLVSDIDKNNKVDIFDYNILVGEFGK